jgi:hypothetical protein
MFLGFFFIAEIDFRRPRLNLTGSVFAFCLFRYSS